MKVRTLTEFFRRHRCEVSGCLAYAYVKVDEHEVFIHRKERDEVRSMEVSWDGGDSSHYLVGLPHFGEALTRLTDDPIGVLDLIMNE